MSAMILPAQRPRHPAAEAAENLRRWRESGQPRRWVEERHGRWTHDDWLALLEELRQSPYWPLTPDAVGAELEECRRLWRNLRRWELSGQPRRWVEERQGQWERDDGLALLDGLARSAYTPLDPAAAEGLLGRLAAEWWNLRHWRESGQPRWWVEVREGSWGHAEWLDLLEALRWSHFWPVHTDDVGRVLEDTKRRYWNLRRWREAGHPRRWVGERQGRWAREDWLTLLEELRRSEYWPLDDFLAELTLEEAQASYWNLWRWRESDQPRRWVEERQGRWDHDDWLKLLEGLRADGLWRVDSDEVDRTLRQLNLEWWNVHRWRTSGLARRWVEDRHGRWDQEDWLALLDALRASDFWPASPEAVRRVVEEVRAELWPAGANGKAPARHAAPRQPAAPVDASALAVIACPV
jgi:hypothetical protein